jgi:hypothetical protein
MLCICTVQHSNIQFIVLNFIIYCVHSFVRKQQFNFKKSTVVVLFAFHLFLHFGFLTRLKDDGDDYRQRNTTQHKTHTNKRIEKDVTLRHDTIHAKDFDDGTNRPRPVAKRVFHHPSHKAVSSVRPSLRIRVKAVDKKVPVHADSPGSMHQRW